MIVIDASSLAKYILREENWERVRHNLVDGPLSWLRFPMLYGNITQFMVKYPLKTLYLCSML